MELRKPRVYTIEGAVFHVSDSWLARKAHEERCRALRDDAEATIEEREEAGETRIASAMQMLADSIMRIEGMTIDGEPVTAWSEDLWRDMSELFWGDLVTRIRLYESDDRLGETETPPEASES